MKKNYIGKVLIVIGSIVIISAFIFKFMGSYKNHKEVEQFKKTLLTEEIQTTQDKKNEDSKDKINAAKNKANENVNKDKARSNKQIIAGTTIGILNIPKINLELAIGEGVDKETLKYAIGHFPDTPMAGKIGNFSLAGHRSHTYNKFFNRLDELSQGDRIRVTTNDGEFEYVVTGKQVVTPDKVDVLNSTDKKTITLVTCTYIKGVSHRLIIKGDMIE